MRSRRDSSRLVLLGTLLVSGVAVGIGLLRWSSPPFEVESDGLPLLPTRVPTVERAATRPERTAREPRRTDRERRPEPPREWPAEEVAAAKDRAPSGEGDLPATEEQAATADSSGDAIERILNEAGLGPEVVKDLQRRFEHTVLAAAETRNVAARDGWLHSPRFSDEMATIEAERQAIRDEIGDDAYDLFLFATGELNRAVLADVESNSIAGEAGLQSGDFILSYDGTRIFSPSDLSAAIDAAAPGTVARLEIRRSRRTIRVDVPAGPLGARIDATQEVPVRMQRR